MSSTAEKYLFGWAAALTALCIAILLLPAQVPSDTRIGASVTATTFTAGNITATNTETAGELTVAGGVGAGAIGSACDAGVQCSTGICAHLACVGPCGALPEGGPDAGDGGDASDSGGGGGGTFTFVQQIASATTSASTLVGTLPATVGAGDLVAVGFFWDNAPTVSSVVDDKGNALALATGTLITGAATFGPGNGAIYWEIPAIAAPKVFTVTFSGPYSNASIFVGDWSAPAGASYDVGSSATGSTSPATTSFTTTHANDLLVGIGAGFFSGAGSGYTSRYLNNPPPGVLEDQTATTAGLYSASAVVSFSSWIMMGASFAP